MTPDQVVPVTGVCELVLEQNDLAAAEHFYATFSGELAAGESPGSHQEATEL